jgi:uncharacterized protein (TIGR03084 family)
MGDGGTATYPSQLGQLVDDLRAEQATLDRLVAGLDEDAWLAPTPAEGWDVRDAISHLAAIDEFALECVEGRHDAAFAGAAGHGSIDAFNQAEVERGRGKRPDEMLAWWRGARERLNEAFTASPPDARVMWGAGPMAVRSLVTARLMECWAHGLDCFAAAGVEPVDTDRLRHVCRLSYRALPYAFQVAGRPMPAPLDDLRLELTAPGGGDVWVFGPAAATQLLTGAAGEWARVAVQRLRRTDAPTLRADGPLATQALEVARSYL